MSPADADPEPAAALPVRRTPGARAGRAGAGVVAVLAALSLLSAAGNALFPGQHGPPSSSYATSPAGLAAYAELLVRTGHPVTQLRRAPADGRLGPGQTIILLDPDTLLPADGRALAAFVAAGGHLVTGGSSGDRFLARILPHPPRLVGAAPTTATALGSPGVPEPAGVAAVPTGAPETAGVADVASVGRGGWSPSSLPPDLRPALGSPDGPPLLLLGTVGRGRIALLADASPLQNQLLARADDARLGVDLAGAPGRPVTFVESVHGYGPAQGLAALPSRWWWAFAGLSLAAVAWVAARWRRLGPPSVAGRALPPARSAYLDAMATILRRRGEPVEAAGLARASARRLVTRGGGLTADAGADEVRVVARRLGLDAEQARLVADDGALAAADLLVLGAALARLQRVRRLEAGRRT